MQWDKKIINEASKKLLKLFYVKYIYRIKAWLWIPILYYFINIQYHENNNIIHILNKHQILSLHM